MSGSLYLTPADCQAPPPQTESIVQPLRQLGLIGEALGESLFKVGDNFHNHVVFAGCAPHLTYSAANAEDLDYCHLALLGPYPEARLITGPMTRRPRCPKCGERAPAWQALQATWRDFGPHGHHSCTACGHAAKVTDWRWQRYAVFGRIFLAVRGVFPAEAVPSETLLRTLEESTGRPWDYAWAATIKQ